jgi:hypothetical protein
MKWRDEKHVAISLLLNKHLALVARGKLGLAMRRRLALVWLIPMLYLSQGSSARGVPVSLAFDATVTSVVEGIGGAAELSFVPQVGTPLYCEFAIDASAASQGISTQDYPLRIRILGSDLNVSIYDLAVDSTVIPLAPPYSSAVLSTSYPTDVFPPGSANRVPGASNTFWTFTSLFAGPAGLLANPGNLESPATWNSLSDFRQFHLQFADVSDPDSRRTTVIADIHLVTLVPEPSSIIVLSLMALLACQRRRSSRLLAPEL